MKPGFTHSQIVLPSKKWDKYLIQDNYKSLNQVNTYPSAEKYGELISDNTVAIFKIKWK
jgi:hypothetical protein